MAEYQCFHFVFDDSSSDESSSLDDSTSESDASVEEVELTNFPFNPIWRRKDVPKIENYVENVVAAMSERDFRSHFRLNREAINDVGDMIMRDPAFKRIRTISLWKQLLMTLWILATPESFRSVSERFGVCKSTLWFAVDFTCSAIARLSLSLIKWPSITEMRASEEAFCEKAGFPGVVGCVDGTHIPISAPTQSPQCYINRKDFHSIILQGIANDRLKFIDCYVGEVGSVHDARVFSHSEVGQHLADYIPEDFHLLGDGAYPLDVNLMTPFRDNGHLTRRQVLYNHKLSQTRSTIERAFGLLKGRFRRLRYLDIKLTNNVPKIVMACCVLHNFAIDMNIEFDEPEIDEPDENDDTNSSVPNSIATRKRNEIMNRL